MQKSLSISTKQGGSSLSPGQKKFNTLVAKIKAQPKLLGELKEFAPSYQATCRAELQPFFDQQGQLDSQLVRLLDRSLADKGFTKAEYAFMRDFVCDLAEMLIHDGDNADEMKAIFQRHSKVDFDVREKEAQAEVKAMMEAELGIDLGDDISSPEALMARLQQEFQARAQVDTDRQAAHATKKTANKKRSAKQNRDAQAAQQASQSLREVYRKLASALHPDREPDDQERARKTALMQRVNQAYDKNDLLSLLQLQLEIEQIDQLAVDGIAEDRLKHYNQVLAEQLRELEMERSHMEYAFREQFDIDWRVRLTPAALMKELVKEKQELQYTVIQKEKQLKKLVDKAGIKKWIAGERKAAKQFALDDFDFGFGGPDFDDSGFDDPF